MCYIIIAFSVKEGNSPAQDAYVIEVLTSSLYSKNNDNCIFNTNTRSNKHFYYFSISFVILPEHLSKEQQNDQATKSI